MTTRTYRVLHVDDDIDFLDLIQTHVDRLSEDIIYETLSDPKETLVRLNDENTEVSAIVTDFDMPGMNGLELLQAIKDARQRIPVILYTGRGSEEVAAEAIRNGVADYLQKGHSASDVQVLLNSVRQAIEKSEAEQLAEIRLAALDTVREGIAIFSAAGELVYSNPAHQRLYDYSLQEAVGSSWTAFHPDKDLGTIREEVLPSVETDGAWEGTGTGLRWDGTEFTESKSISKLPDGGFVVVVLDTAQEYTCL